MFPITKLEDRKLWSEAQEEILRSLQELLRTHARGADSDSMYEQTGWFYAHQPRAVGVTVFVSGINGEAYKIAQVAVRSWAEIGISLADGRVCHPSLGNFQFD